VPSRSFAAFHEDFILLVLVLVLDFWVFRLRGRGRGGFGCGSAAPRLCGKKSFLVFAAALEHFEEADFRRKPCSLAPKNFCAF
jgi:hypothetical protein